MRDDPRIIPISLCARDQRLLHAAAEWSRCMISKNTDRIVPKTDVFCYERADIGGLLQEASAFHYQGSIGLGPKPTHELLCAKNKDGLEQVLRYGMPADDIYPHGEAILMIGTLVHEYAHVLFARSLQDEVLAEFRRQGRSLDEHSPKMRAINEAFSYSMQKKITGLYTLAQDMADEYADKADTKLLITYHIEINGLARRMPVDEAMLAVVRERGTNPVEQYTLPASKYIVSCNAMTRQRRCCAT